MFKRSLILHLFIGLLLSTGLLYLGFNSLDWFTNHGKVVKVPQLVGQNLDAVMAKLKEQKFDVYVDSTYKSYVDPLQVLQQEPAVGSSVKYGRTIFLVVNRKEAPKIAMPDLVSKSFRNAQLIMKSYRLVMGDTLFRPDIAAGAVLEQRFNGKQVSSGQMIPYGAKIDLVIGEGLADYEVDVPNLIGVRWGDAKGIIKGAGLFEAVVWTGEITDSSEALIYKQFPEALNDLDFPQAIRGGDMLDLHIMQKPSESVLKQNAPGSLKYLTDDDSSYNEIESRLIARPKLRKRTDTSNKFLKSDEELAAEAIEQEKTNQRNVDSWNRSTTPSRRKVGSRSSRMTERATSSNRSSSRSTSRTSRPRPKADPSPPPKPKEVVEEKVAEDYGDEFE